MKRSLSLIGSGFVAVIVWAAPSVFPTGTTIYDPSKTWSGYTVLWPLGTQAALVIDMNGNVAKRWEGLSSSAGGPVRILPGGMVIPALFAVLCRRVPVGSIWWNAGLEN